MDKERLRRHCILPISRIVVSEFPRNHRIYWLWIDDKWQLVCDWFDPHGFNDIPRTTRHPESDHAWAVLQATVEENHSSVVPFGKNEYVVSAKGFVLESHKGSVANAQKVCAVWRQHFHFEICEPNPYAEGCGRISCGFTHEYSLARVLHALAIEAVGDDLSHVECLVQRVTEGLYFKGDQETLEELTEKPSKFWT